MSGLHIHLITILKIIHYTFKLWLGASLGLSVWWSAWCRPVFNEKFAGAFLLISWFFSTTTTFGIIFDHQIVQKTLGKIGENYKFCKTVCADFQCFFVNCVKQHLLLLVEWKYTNLRCMETTVSSWLIILIYIFFVGQLASFICICGLRGEWKCEIGENVFPLTKIR